MTKIENAYFAAGQFYKPQLLFDQLHGVSQTTVGYMSTEPDEEYDMRDIKMGKTHFLDTVKVEFDADEIDFRTLLDFFWQTVSLEPVSSNEPTYNTAIFCCDDLQHALARLSKLEHQQQFLTVIPTVLANAHTFYPAAGESQKYYASTGLFGIITEEEERAQRRKIKGLDQFDPAL
jgi:peptide-methionine (S)-S-oxide reductase